MFAKDSNTMEKLWLLQMLLVVACLATRGAAVVCVCCKATSVNIRGSPDPDGRVWGILHPHECMYTLGCTDGWCSVIHDIQEKFVSQDLVTGPQQCGHPSEGTCLQGHCAGNDNVGRPCDGSGCGYYGAPRGGSTHGGTDVVCSADQTIYAPFDGIMDRSAPPYTEDSCCNDGFEYVSTDPDFQNFKFKVFYAKDYTIGETYSAGDAIATHIGLHCGCYSKDVMTDHSHVEIRVNDVRVDPTSYMYCDYNGV